MIKSIIIDKLDDPTLYRYNVEFEDGKSIGSCFCYHTAEEAFFKCYDNLVLDGEFEK